MPLNSHHRYSVENICELIRNEQGLVSVKKFLWALAISGVRKTDPRLKELMAGIELILSQSKQQNANPKIEDKDMSSGYIKTDEFKQLIADHLSLLDSILRHDLAVPDWREFCDDVQEMFEICKTKCEGRTADYIPNLARVDPSLWAVSICTVDGQRYSCGDHKAPFSIQSTSKPINYAIALNEAGAEKVHKYVGQEPSGRTFNELVLDHNNKPHNPMINAGAITVCSLLHRDHSAAERFDYIFKLYQNLAGGEYVGFSNGIYLSECETADRNFAISYFLRENRCFPPNTNLKETIELYFQLCSIEANSDSFAVIAAALANGGICPITNEAVLDASCIQHVLSLMHSCGMYDYSGQFSFKVGLPAKSGVSGAIMLVVPNVMGICLYSPALDKHGNSCRGVEFCQLFVEKFNFHVYDNIRRSHGKIDPRLPRQKKKKDSDVEVCLRKSSVQFSQDHFSEMLSNGVIEKGAENPLENGH